jgi:cell division protein FtsI/penicillin-binding protein 2
MHLDLIKGSRSRILATALLLIAIIFVGRLFYLQIIRHDHYVALASIEQQDILDIPASRGLIYAKDGDAPVQLVMNQKVYSVIADPKVVTQKDEIVTALREIAGSNLRPSFDVLLDKKDTRYQILATKLTRTQAEKLKEKDFFGLVYQPNTQRVYPEGALAGQVLGFVNVAGQGNYGIEGYLNEELKGIDGSLKTVTDVSKVPLTIGDDNVRIPAKNGQNVVLSIDRNVQSKAEQALAAGLQRTGATEGSVVVMNPRTGKVMAMANLPTYNPAEFNTVQDGAVFNNNAISKPYEPGSVLKTYTLAAGIDKGVVKTSDTYNNTDSIKIGDNYVVGNATKGQTGIITFQRALTWSLNTGFVTIAQRLGDGKSVNQTARSTMYEYFHDKFRLGTPTGIELANEAPGSVFSPEDEQGNAVRYATMSFGQGLDTTVLQVAAGFSAIVNGGDYYKPTIIDGYITDEGYKPNAAPTPLQAGVISKATSQEVVEATHEARASSFGRTDKPGYYIGGKTGTAQVGVAGGYSDKETIASYLGYGGGNQMEYVIMVELSGKDKVLGGAQDALPVFTDISNWMLDYLKVQPKG